ncbi:MAG: hypothetical protein ACM33C_03850 [Syntrophaceae bacterium]
MRDAGTTGRKHTISFTLKPVAPFRLDYAVRALRRRPGNAIDRWDGPEEPL